MELTRGRVLRLLLTSDLRCFTPPWLKLVAGLPLIVAFFAMVPVAFLGTAFWPDVLEGTGTDPWTWVVAAATAAAAAFTTAAFAAAQWRRRYRRRCPAISLDDHPRLRAVVADAVRIAGVGEIGVTRVAAWAEVRAGLGRRGRVEVLLGLPLLMGLSERDLRAVLVRELLTLRLWSWHERWGVHLAGHHPDRAWLREAAAGPRQRLWDAARSLVGAAALTAASRAELTVAAAFGWHVNRYAAVACRLGAPGDVHESFLWKVTEEGLAARVHPRAVMMAAEPALFGGHAWDPDTLDAPGGLAGGLDARVGHRLGQVVREHVLGGGGGLSGGRRVRMDELPPDVWAAAGREQARLVLGAAGVLLGRAATARDVVELAVAGRAGELEWWHVTQSCPHPSPAVCALMPLFDVALRAAGYAPAHPYAEHVLVGAQGERADLEELAARAARGEPYGIALGEP
ncbi:hypothetical protein AB0L05_21395 [Nonomuraea pusilla]|uniref:hypothetical protein n=1 Tax=Nonomuraea pusilla TaxID=46177 RepID=UPI00332CF2B6